jgi:hypothetical protein
VRLEQKVSGLGGDYDWLVGRSRDREIDVGESEIGWRCWRDEGRFVRRLKGIEVSKEDSLDSKDSESS